jgi:hypothetical protein
MRQIILSCLFLISLIGTASASTLQILSPSTPITVYPGQIVSVTVQRSADIEQFLLIGTVLGESTGFINGSDPVTTSITIPQTLEPGTYSLAAVDATVRETKGFGIISNVISISVEPQEVVTSIRPEADQINLEYPGDTYKVTISAASETNSWDINEAPGVTFKTLDESIATVDPTGLVTAIGSGKTDIQISYQNLTTSFMITVSKTIQGDLNNDGKVDIDDLNILQDAMGTPAHGQNDARDLNHDGKIDNQDVADLETLCTFPNCAYSPPTNRPPVANAGSGQTVECTGPTGANVMLNSSGSSDPDGDPLTFAWTGPFGSVNGATPTIGLPLGQSVINLTVDDGRGASATAQVTETVVDTTPPTVSAALVPLKQHGEFRVAYSCNDTCSANPTSSATLNGIAVTNGQTVILKVAKTAKSSFRKGILSIQGPTFTLSASCTDQAGNTGTGTAKYP